MGTDGAAPWWRRAVLYQIYPRSFADADGDGTGDLAGVIGKLDYLAWLGVEGMWLNPIMPSPDDDWGYDVADYCDVHPDLGTLADLDRLVGEARRRGIAVLLDLVANHSSVAHPWFQDSRRSHDSPRRDWYVWADPAPGGGPPNNWRNVFDGGDAWEPDPTTGQLYLHNFLVSMPDLNWWSDEVRDEFDRILRFWFDRGVAGFRIDVAHGIVKDRELRDNLPVTDDDHPEVRRHGQKHVYNMNRPEVHDVLRRWRGVADGYDEPRILVGETYVLEVAEMARYYGSANDELNLAFNFPFIFSALERERLAEVVAETERLLPAGGWPVWTASNHDVGRFPTRWCGGDEARIRCVLAILLTLRGTPFLLYGDEIGMEEVDVPPDRTRDPVARMGEHVRGRDGGRTPMQWEDAPNGGFCPAGVEPWLPVGDAAARNVAAQRDDPASTLSFVRDLIALRRGRDDLLAGDYRPVEAPAGVWAWRRGAGTLVAVNLGDGEAAVPGVGGTVLLATDRARDREPVGGALRLAPASAAVVDLRP